MRIPFEWLREFVDVRLSPEDLAERLTMAGTEVSAIEFHGKGIEGVVVGKIKAIEPHHKARDLMVLQVDIGTKIVQIITNIKNLKIGDKVPVAKAGAKLAEDLKVEKRELHGIESFGMLCSTAHLGLSDIHNLMILDKDAPVGQDIKNVLGVKGVILEVEVLPNRGDLQSIMGIAREVSALLKKPLKFKKTKVKESNSKKVDVKIEVKDGDLCPRYTARIIEGVKVGESPEWLKARLIACGLRPINNVVDATNYVLLELGQPLHAFDLDLVGSKKIIVRRAKGDEKIKTIDGETRHLNKDMLVIADGKRPVAVAGVMGGLDTEVTEKTTSVLLESAYFKPSSINSTSKILKMRSESSSRFEKGVDFEGVKIAQDRCASLISQLAGGRILKKVFDIKAEDRKSKGIELRLKRVEDVLGKKIDVNTVSSILNYLGFKVKKGKTILNVIVPLYRAGDIEREIDLIEEIARMYGYDKVDTKVPKMSREISIGEKKDEIKRVIRDVLCGFGVFETQTFSIINPKQLDLINIPQEDIRRDLVRITNPLSEDISALRSFLFPSLLKVLSHNYKRMVHDVLVFEIGKIFLKKDGKLPLEREILSLAAMGNIPAKGKVDFFYLKGILEELFKELGFESFKLVPSKHFALDSLICADIKMDEKNIGFVGGLNSNVSSNYDLPQGVVLFEVDLENIFEFRPSIKRFKPLPRFPKVSRDIAMFVPQGVSHASICELIKEVGGSLVESVTLFDMYKGKQVPEGFSSMAYRVDYRDPAKTLTDKEVNEIHSKVSTALENKFNVEIRKQ